MKITRTTTKGGQFRPKHLDNPDAYQSVSFAASGSWLRIETQLTNGDRVRVELDREDMRRIAETYRATEEANR